MIRDIIQDVLKLRRYSERVRTAELAADGKADTRIILAENICGLVADLCDTLAPLHGYGLAACQIGVLKRLFVMKTFEGARPRPRADWLVYVNPEARSYDPIVYPDEGCFSFPGVYKDTRRFMYTEVKALIFKVGETEQAMASGPGCWRKQVNEGRGAVALQHEMDHLDGTLFLDKERPLPLRKWAEV